MALLPAPPPAASASATPPAVSASMKVLILGVMYGPFGGS
jgi:hypothetical protein